jgi:hypothetical protein
VFVSQCVHYTRTYSLKPVFRAISYHIWDTRQRSWLRHSATSWKVAVFFSDAVNASFNLPNPSSSTMALGSTQPLTEMSASNHPGGGGVKSGRRIRLTSPPYVSRLSRKCGNFDVSQLCSPPS